MYKFKSFGVMVDMSRNAVMSVDGLKKFMPLLAKMGYNTLLLYTEDTYEVDGEPFFGYMRGRYTKDELKALDDYAYSLGIELIPCIQTLAHLNATIRWGQFPTDAEDILLVGDERCYALIDHMLASCAECFRSRRIHVGMDEAHQLGRGRYLTENGYETVDKIMKKHLGRVVEIASKYGFEPMMWSDMFFNRWTGGRYYVEKTEIPHEYIEARPESVTPVYWDYYHTKEKCFDDMIYNHKQFTDDIWFAGGVWTWCGFCPNNEYSLRSMIPAIKSCRKNKVKNVFFTMWGDNGGECSRFAALPALFYLSEYAKGHTDDEKIKAKFKRFTGIDFDEFMALDLPDHVNVPDGSSPRNPAKYMLYSDCFNGFLDGTVKKGIGEEFGRVSRTLAATAKKSRRYGYLFDNLAKLCSALEVKAELGVKTREAYRSGDKDALRALANNDYCEAIKRIKLFAASNEKQWMLENKPQGFDVQDIRLGGCLRRLESCRRRLLDYVDGKVESIPELEGELLPFGAKDESIIFNDVLKNMTVGAMYWGV